MKVGYCSLIILFLLVSVAQVRSAPPPGLREQTVRLSLPAKVVYGSTYKLKASASSKLPLTFSVSDPDIAELTGGKVKILQAKPFEVTAEQAGNEKWAPTSKTINVTPSKRPQRIGFTVKGRAKVGEVLNLNVTLRSGLPVTITSSDAAKIRIDGTTATALAPGKVTLTATQAGDDNHEAAKPVNKTVVVTNPAPSAPSGKVAKFRTYQPWGNRAALEMETSNAGVYVRVNDSAARESVWRGESLWRGNDAWTSYDFEDFLRSWRPADLYNEAPDEYGVAWVTFDNFGLAYMNSGSPPFTWDNVDSMDGPLPLGGLQVFLPGELDWAIQDDGGIFFDSRNHGAGENANTMFDYVDTISGRSVALRDPDDSKLTLYVGGYEALYEVTPFETIKHSLSAHGASAHVNKLEYSGSRLWISYNGRILTLSNGQISLFANASGPLSWFGLDNFCIANGNVYASNGLRYPMSGGPGVPWIKRSGALNPANPAESQLMVAVSGGQLYALKNAVSSQIFFLFNNKIYVVDPL